MSFVLDPRLNNDGILLAENSEFLLNLANDSRYPWVILIPKVTGATDIHSLDTPTQQRVTTLSSFFGREMMKIFDGDSFNLAALGNVVTQLHIHHVIRYKDDEAWPAPIWGVGDARPYSSSESQLMIEKLQPLCAALNSN